MSNVQPYDVIIVGAGPAGSTAGYLLSKAGLRTVLVDRRVFPRRKLCAGLITQKTINTLERIFCVSGDSLKSRGVINYESHRYCIYNRKGG